MWTNRPMQETTYRKIKSTYSNLKCVELGAQVATDSRERVIIEKGKVGDPVHELPKRVTERPDDPLDRGDLRTIHEEYEHSRPIALIYGDSEVDIIDNESDARASL